MKFTFTNKADYESQRKALLDEAQTLINNGDFEGANAISGEKITALDNAYEEFATAQANLKAMQGTKSNTLNNILEGTKMENNNGTTYASRAEMLNSVEYRTAFMNNVLKGEKIPERFLNSDAQTTTGEVTSVIPTVLIQKIYSKLETVGKFFAMATKTNFKGGVTVPTSAVNLTASWVAERGTSDTQEAPTGSITFTYHKLICKVSVSFEADVVTLDIFETDLVEKVSKAMVKAIEQAMFTGNGTNCPKGFLTETVATGQGIEIAEGSHFTYEKLLEAEGAIPEEYEGNAIWVMPKKTYYNEILAITDENGQPIARTDHGINGKPERTILGRRVEFAPYMSEFATSVTEDTIVAAIFDFGAYAINTNYAMTIKKYTDEDTDDQITKALMLADGKVIDKNSLVTVTIKNS